MQNATYRAGELPIGTTGTLEVQMSNTIISGGSTILTVSSDRELTKLYIYFAGSFGYYEVNISESDLISYLDGNYIYNVLLQFTQNLLGQSSQTTESMQISFSVTTGSDVSPPVLKNVEAIKVGSGALQVSLSWNTVVDLDLHITPPSGTTIYYGRKKVDNGELDLDANVGCPGSRDKRNENTFFTAPLADGDYTIEVNMYTNCITTATRYMVSAYINGNLFVFSPNQSGEFAAGTNNRTKKVIGVIRIKNGVFVPYTPSSSSIGGISSSSRGNSSSSSSLGSSSSSGGSSSSSVTSSSSPSSVGGCPNATVGNGTLTCGGQTYKTVVIGTQTWMAENLNYNVSGSVCYNNNQANCTTYGRLYDWATAMGIDAKYNSEEWDESDVKHRGICPSGWHLPSDAEWITLTNFVDPNDPYVGPGTKLKATSGWDSYSGQGPFPAVPPGSDIYGFQALPGGGYMQTSYMYINEFGIWWSASEYCSERCSEIPSMECFATTRACVRTMDYDDEGVHDINEYKSSLFSIRCVKD